MERVADRRRRLGDFLRSKRASLVATHFDLPTYGRRRVSGLRREEVALLVGISVTWYTQIECGAAITISPALLARIADVYRLSPIERAYVFTLGIDEMGVIATVAPQLETLAGSRIAASTFDEEIALVLGAHRAIKTHIYATVVHGTFDALEPHLDEARCPIGVWLHDDLCATHRRGTQYTRAARAHVAFHREIAKVVRVGNAGEARAMERLLVGASRYVNASTVLERAFARWPHARAA
ncbi:MAG: hypothetical protein NVS3B17_20550 [Vulcanimicrobiaceae bacterium]